MNDGKKRFWSRLRIGVAACVILNVAAIFWIRGEVLDFFGNEKTMEHDGPQLRVIAVSPDEGRVADDADRLTFVFNQAVVTEQEIGKRLSWEPFSIEPAPRPAGQWVWVKPSMLEYQLGGRLPLATGFQVTAGDDYVRWLGLPLRGQREFTFSTRSLAVKECVIHSNDHIQTKVNLRFNQSVDPKILKEGLVCRDAVGAKAIEWELLNSSVGKDFNISLPTPTSRRLQVTLPKGLTGANGPLGLESSFLRNLNLSPSFAPTDARPPYSRGTDRMISVTLCFNRQLDATQPVPKVQMSPEVKGLVVSVAGNALRLTGSFDRGDGMYDARVLGDVRAHDGEVLPAGAVYAFKVPKRRPTVRFPHDRGYLSPRGNLALDLETAAVGNLMISAQRVYRNNLGTYLRRSFNYWHGYSSLFGKDVATEEIPIQREGDEVVRTVVDLKKLLEEPRGVYRIKVSATDKTWVGDEAFVSVTDLAITTKTSAKGVFVWVTSLEKATPVQGAQVVVLSDRNQPIAEGKTDEQGIVQLEAPSDHPDGQPWLVTAEKGDDLSYRLLDQRKWQLSDVPQDGRNPVDAYDLFLYAERGVYRPGDVIRMTGVVRDPQGNVPPVFPLEIHAWQPDGRKVRSWSISPDDGLFHAEFPTHPDGQTGSYRFAVGLPGSDSYFGESNTLVEAFEPVRIEAKAIAAKPMFGPGDDNLVNLSARYLFGQPAARMPYQLKGAYYRVPFKSKNFPRHRFEILDGDKAKPSARCVDVTDDDGNAEITVDDTGIRHLPGFWEGRFHATITTPGGRSVSDRVTFRTDPVGRHLGMAFSEDFPPPPSESFDVNLVMVDAEDKAVPLTETDVVLERVHHNWVLQQVDGSRVWRVQKTYTRMEQLTSGNDGVAKFEQSLTMNCPTAGSYRLTARNLHSGAKSQVAFYVSSYGDHSDPALASPHRVTLKLDKEKHLPGETARIRVAAPFAGRLLLTLETDRPIALRSMLMDKAETDVEIEIPDTVRGSAFISATVIRPLDFDSPDWKPHRAYGLTRLPIDHSGQFLHPVIEAPTKVEPNTEVTLRVNTPLESLGDESARVHLWAVDEGILLVTDHETPDPGKHFFANRRNLVDSGDLYLELLPDHKRPVSMDRTGAGGGRAPARLIKPQPREPIVLWRTFAKAGPDGTFETTFQVPDFNGELRFMAVVVAGDSYGSTDHALTVASPLLVEPSWPRFVAPGDHFRVPVKVFNSTEVACSPKLTFNLDGPVVAKWEKGDRMQLAPGKSKTLWLSAEATGLGHVQAEVLAQTSELKAGAKAKFFSRPASVLHVERRSIQIKAGEQFVIKKPDAIIGETETTVTVSPIPSLDLRPAVDRLMTFPYGCVEQTSSRIAPMLFAANLFDGGRAEYLRRLVDVGLDRLASMQTASGGLAYWPGNRDPYMWGTCYASLIIAEATSAGHKATRIDQKALATYLARSLKEENPGLNEQALLCRVLAVFKQPELARQSFLLSRLDELDVAGRAHLAAAWLESGRRDQAVLALPDDTLQLKPAVRSTGRRLTSPVAQEAILLSVLLSLDEDHPWIPELVERLNLSRKTGKWRSTLDDGLAVAALSRYQASREVEPGEFTGTLSMGDNEQIAFTSKQSKDFTFKGREPIRLTSEGSGKVYLAIKSEGLALLDRSNEQDKGIVVRRRWLDADGRVIRDWTPNGEDEDLPPLNLTLGQLIRVEVRLSTRGRGRVHNIAVVDALPGGMEVENPRLSTSVVDDDHKPIIPSQIDFLDDRVVLFASAGSRPDTYSYSLRAITQGEFSIPAVQATCMYDSSMNSLHGAGKIRITPIQ